ncbi:MAG: hypothetical protein QOI24_71 [Acidobacteriota bacterium]|jgi:hypothetical protein|nr:hypothetical protein [Acidobacteriota bacterium]
MTRRVLAAILFASLAWTTVPALLHLAREAAALRKLPLGDRRALVTKGFSRATRDVLASTAPNERLALVPRYDHPGESDAAVFFNYYAYPRATRTWSGLSAYALDADPRRPANVVGFGDGPHRTTYAGLRGCSPYAANGVRPRSSFPSPRCTSSSTPSASGSSTI